MHRRAAAALAVPVLALLAGCGGGDSSSDNAPGPDETTEVPQANVIYERAYSECASTDLQALAGKYQTKNPSVDVVARAVGESWSERFGGGDAGVRIGESGCRDGLDDRDDSPAAA